MGARKATAFPYEYLIVAALCLINFGPVSFCLSCAGIFYTPVAEDIGTSPATLSYFLAAFSVSMVMALTPLGKLFNRIDCRAIMTASIGIIVACFVGLSFVRAAWQFLALAFVMGFGLTSCVYLAPPILVNRWFSKRSGFFIGIVMAFTGVGGMLWATVGGALIASMGWRATYLVFAALTAAIGLPCALLVLKDRPSVVGRVPYGYEPGNAGEAGDMGDVADVGNVGGSGAAGGAGSAGVEVAAGGTGGTDVAADVGGTGRVGGTGSAGAISYEQEGVEASVARKSASFPPLLAFSVVISLNVYVYGMIPSYVTSLPASADFPLLGAVASSCAMAASIVAKVLWGGLGEKNIVATVIAACACALAGLALFAIAPAQWLLVCAAGVAYGMIYGEQTVFCPIVTRQFYGVRSYGEVYSTVSMLICIGVIATSFVGGTIVNVTGSYLAMFAFIATALVVACVLLVVAKKLNDSWRVA